MHDELMLVSLVDQPLPLVVEIPLDFEALGIQKTLEGQDCAAFRIVPQAECTYIELVGLVSGDPIKLGYRYLGCSDSLGRTIFYRRT